MADFTGLRDAALSVRAMLRDAITFSDDPSLNGIEVDLRSPREMDLASVTDVVSLWIHRVEVQPDLVNRAPKRLSRELEAHRSLPVELVLHATAVFDDAPTALLVTGRVLQTVFDHRRLADPALVGSLVATGTELFLAFEAMTAYDTNLVWSGLHSHQRLGVGVRVSGLLIDSTLHPISQNAVLTRQAGVEQILEVV